MDEVYVTGTITSSRLKSFGPDQTMSKCAGNLPEDRVLCSDFVDDCTDGARSEHLPVMLPEFDLNPNLQSLSPHLQSFQPNSTPLRERIHKNQLQASKQSI